jgi:hypothetical protein
VLHRTAARRGPPRPPGRRGLRPSKARPRRCPRRPPGRPRGVRHCARQRPGRIRVRAARRRRRSPARSGGRPQGRGANGSGSIPYRPRTFTKGTAIVHGYCPTTCAGAVLMRARLMAALLRRHGAGSMMRCRHRLAGGRAPRLARVGAMRLTVDRSGIAPVAPGRSCAHWPPRAARSLPRAHGRMTREHRAHRVEQEKSPDPLLRPGDPGRAHYGDGPQLLLLLRTVIAGRSPASLPYLPDPTGLKPRSSSEPRATCGLSNDGLRSLRVAFVP